MLESLFVTSGTTTTSIDLVSFLISIGAALVLGFILAFAYSFRSRFTRSFLTTLATLPAIVAIVIAMVNGNVGTGVAVAGAFSLVRFRSVAGGARDIAFIFLAMAVGLVCGMGYITYAVIITLIMSAVGMVYQGTGFGALGLRKDRSLRITVPEDFNYTELFDDLLDRYTNSSELISVKTTNMGSLYRLNYNVMLKDPAQEREFIDELRCRNGNLEIIMCTQEANSDEL
ncbi:MAG: DUF4956 domain-containing protein [Atopobiaceae bacterium]|nr:DUF4956 domain-containing protein [Atopobiaceae bacterium]